MSELFVKRGLLELILSSLMLIIMTIILIHFIRNEWKNETRKVGCRFWKLPPHTLLVLLSFIFFISFTIESNILSGYWILYANPRHTFYPPWCMAHMTHNILFAFAKVAMYLFWFVRLHQVFESTVFAISTTKLKALAAFFNLPILITSVYVLYLHFYMINNMT